MVVAREPRRAAPLTPLLPVLYFTTAHAAFVLALLAIAVDPRGIAGFFYHSRIVAIVHLITLGWITCSIVGAIYIVAPLALRATLPVRRVDYLIWGDIVVGVAGMVIHFWLGEHSGMAWSAAMVAIGLAAVAGRVLPVIRRAALPAPIRLHLTLAMINLLSAATMGVLLGFDKAYHFLPGFVLGHVYAHAHLAAIGWVAMMAVGVGYRLVPMLLGAPMPSGPTVYATAVLLEVGVWGLFASLLVRSRASGVFAVLVCAGFALFLADVSRMARRRGPRSADRTGRAIATRHACAALGWLAVSCALGLVLAFGPSTEWTLRLALAYGTGALIGCFAQFILGMEIYVLPLYGWCCQMQHGDLEPTGSRPPAFGAVELSRAGWWLWVVGVPALAAGLALDAVPWVAGGAWMLLAAVIAHAINCALVLGRRSVWRLASAAPLPPSASNPAAQETA